jgi:hypothetical protein
MDGIHIFQGAGRLLELLPEPVFTAFGAYYFEIYCLGICLRSPEFFYKNFGPANVNFQ